MRLRWSMADRLDRCAHRGERSSSGVEHPLPKQFARKQRLRAMVGDGRELHGVSIESAVSWWTEAGARGAEVSSCGCCGAPAPQQALVCRRSGPLTPELLAQFGSSPAVHPVSASGLHLHAPSRVAMRTPLSRRGRSGSLSKEQKRERRYPRWRPSMCSGSAAAGDRAATPNPGSTEPATRFGCRDTQTGAPLKLG